MASVALIAHYESEASARITGVVLVGALEAFDEPMELIALVELVDVIGSTNVDATDEYAQQGKVAMTVEDGVELIAEIGDVLVRP